ncbi:MAG: hypothetical protein SPE00_04530 [Bacilli bacterium]|nr:hypothetical protein [Bacilli bacterium]
MKNKKVYAILIVLILIGSLFLTYNIYQNKNKVIKTKKRKQNNLAIMIKEDGATDYIKSNSKDIPKGDYVLNRDKSYCKNNGKIGDYDSVLGKVSFSFVGTDSCYLYFDYEVPDGWKTILINNGNGATTVDAAKAYIEGRTTSTTPDFSTVATANEGMYSAPDDLGTSYYFRGAVDNNWLKYGKYTKDMYNCNNGTISATDTGNSCTKIASSGDDIYWRIIRINGDNSIRMIYSGVTPPTESTKVKKTEDTSLGKSPFNANRDKAEYVGYMYEIGKQHGTSKSSDIKTFLDNWYANYTDLNATGTKITDQIYCNDRTTSTSGGTSWNSTGTYDYGAYGRVWTPLLPSVLPDYKCPLDSDRFTVNKINGKGNGVLNYPIGLITADELTFAGLPGRETNGSFYLHTGAYYWSGSPGRFDDGAAYEFVVRGDGFMFDDSVMSSGRVRGVVSLSSKAKLSGNGTYNDVYRVVGDNSTEDTSSGKSFDTVFAANDTDIFSENGLRYEGADPKNYICLDNKKSGTCSSSSLLFRIIGLFEEEYSTNGTTSSGTKKLLKVIDTNNYGGTSGKYWNQTQTSGKNYNDWSTATLKTELNDLYLRTLLATSGVNSKLSSEIVNAKWHLGGANNTSGSNYYNDTITIENYYKAERSPYATSGTLQNLYSGNPEYVFAQVGLMYPSDYGYATVGGSTTSKANCRAKELYNWESSSYSDCKNNDWLFKSATFISDVEWLISPNASLSNRASGLSSSGYVHAGDYVSKGQFAVRPTFYLDSSILKIVGGLGTKDNAYRIG